jgi:hypothetical protein
METPNQSQPEENKDLLSRRNFLKGAAALAAGSMLPLETEARSYLRNNEREDIEAQAKKIIELQNDFDYRTRTIEILQSLSEQEMQSYADYVQPKEMASKATKSAAIGAGVGAAFVGGMAALGLSKEMKKKDIAVPAIMGTAVGTFGGAMVGSMEEGQEKRDIYQKLFKEKYGMKAFVDRLKMEKTPMTHEEVLREIKRLHDEKEGIKKKHDFLADIYNAKLQKIQSE